MKKPTAKVSILAVIILAAISWMTAAFMLSGCGKKAPPEPPSGNKPPKVIDLAYSISNNTIKLSWTIPKPDDKAKSPVTGFLIYGSKQSSLETDCPNCPIRFKEIGDVPVRGAGPGQSEPPPVVFTDTIEPGYRYIYKVRAYDDDGVTGRDSDFVDFTY
jgi:hypothetical protein